MASSNAFTTVGAALLVDYLDTLTWKLGIGSGTNAAVIGDSALQTPIDEPRVSTSDTQPTSVTFKMSGSITLTGTRAITEAGIFDGAGAGNPPTGANLYSRHVHDVDNLISGDIYTLNVTWTLTPS